MTFWLQFIQIFFLIPTPDFNLTTLDLYKGYSNLPTKTITHLTNNCFI